VALVRIVLALIDLGHAVLSVTVEAFLALAVVAGVSLAVNSSLRDANSINMASSFAVFAVVGLVAGCFSELLELVEIEILPCIIALWSNLVDDSLKSMYPFASGGILSVIDPLAANDTGGGFARNGSSGFTKFRQLSGDLVPVVDGSRVIVGSLEGDSLELLVGEGRILCEVAFSGLSVVRVGAFGSVAVDVKVSIHALASVAIKLVDAVGVVVAVVLSEKALV